MRVASWRRYKDVAKEKAEALVADHQAAVQAGAEAAAMEDADAGDSGPGEAAAAGSGEGGDAARDDGGAADGDPEGVAEEVAGTAAPQHFPISVVRKIMCLDEDVQRISSGAARATACAAELFIQVQPSAVTCRSSCSASW